MLVTCKLQSKFCASAPWQLGTFAGVGLAFLALIFDLLHFPGPNIAVAIVMAIMAAGAALSGIFNLPWGPILIKYGILPLLIGGLAVAFKFASLLDVRNNNADQQTFLICHQWFQVIASLAAFLFVFMFFLYLTKTLLWPKKVKKEWDDLQQSPCFSCITMCFMLFGFYVTTPENLGPGRQDSSLVNHCFGLVLLCMLF